MENIEVKKNNNIINSKKNEKQSPRDLKIFKKIVKEKNFHCIIFKSVYDLVLIVFNDKNYTIVTYNAIDDKKVSEIKNAHKIITELNHCLDKNNKRDLISSISLYDNNLKIWDFNNFECILNIDFKIGNFYLNLNSLCFLSNGNEIHLIASSVDLPQTQLIHIYNLRGDKIKELNDDEVKNFFVDTFYDEDFLKKYIIISTNADVRAIDYDNNKIIKHYTPVNEEPKKVISIKNKEMNKKLGLDENHTIKTVKYAKGPLCVLVKKFGNITKLIAGMEKKGIKIWNFHSTELIGDIIIPRLTINCIRIWDQENLLVGTSGGLKLIDLNKNNIVKNNADIVSIVRMDICTIPKYGKCLITSDLKEMILWINKSLTLK